MTSVQRPKRTFEDDVATIKMSVLMVHGQATVEELPEELFDVGAETISMRDGEPDEEHYREGVLAMFMNLAGAVSDGDINVRVS